MVNAQPEISAPQVRAARAWLGWSQEFLAKQAGVSKRAVVRAESGSSQPHKETAARLRTALEAAGLKFLFFKMRGTGIEVSDLDPKE
ncbi:helix-turn-helix transcriptional regulator [Nitrobacter sp. 62-13]|uniref:helix-turn-helix transcriptional regulator n=1 Tax=Nitrobacter sp. 62-13 TaxID=1895797 RepID=UPI0025CD72C1|nr:helix-turn-helix transcriptional regulator [Nitrobacter sp. 62-13]